MDTSGKNGRVHGSVLEFSPETTFLDGLVVYLSHAFSLLQIPQNMET